MVARLCLRVLKGIVQASLRAMRWAGKACRLALPWQPTAATTATAVSNQLIDVAIDSDLVDEGSVPATTGYLFLNRPYVDTVASKAGTVVLTDVSMIHGIDRPRALI